MAQLRDERSNADPAFAEEAEKLAQVLEHIDVERAKLEGRMPATASDRETAQGIQEILQQQADSFYTALDQPYFGRLDFLPKDNDDNGETVERPMQTAYLGITYVSDMDVYSWVSPVAKLWYTQSYEDGYTAPKGYIPTRVDLKRYIRIRKGNLERVTEIFRRRLPATDSPRQGVLTEALSGVGGSDGHLQVIVETIEPDQYENIANVTDRVLIVQGAAGSGKSEIGQHRIAFLLSPFNGLEESERPTPSTTLFVGPSQAFLEYAAEILPALEVVENVEQVRFSEWLSGQMSDKRVPLRAGIWNNLLDRGEITRYNGATEAFKGSLTMADAMERHIAEIASSIRQRCRDLLLEIPGLSPGNRLQGSQLGDVLKLVLPTSDRGQGLNRARSAFIDRITGLLFPSEQRRMRTSDRSAWERRRREVRNTVTSWCDGAWKNIDFMEEYKDLLADTDRMARLASTDAQSGAIIGLADSAERIRARGFDDSDLGALAYLDHLLNNTVRRRYRHIVIDEAQDISPIEFKLLAAASTNNWFTVLGDTAQRLTPYRGVRAWRDLERVFGRADIEVQRARRSYRSTRQITEFNNRILRTFDRNILSPLPFEREGRRVEYRRHSNTDRMYQGVIDDIARIRSMEGMEDAIIAVLVRDQANLNRFHRFCEVHDINDIVLVDQAKHSDARTVVARIADVKGLEYDAVIVMGVNESFSDTDFNKKLLYLATTRAKHYLCIHWSGKQSPILEGMSQRGVTRRRE